MSKISDKCKNNGKHSGTGRYWICERCEAGLFKTPCGDYKTEGKSYLEKIRENSIVLSPAWRAGLIEGGDYMKNEEDEELLNWPCQYLWGGRGSGIYDNINGRCKHPECHPRNEQLKTGDGEGQAGGELQRPMQGKKEAN